jgi:hypothetical protein
MNVVKNYPAQRAGALREFSRKARIQVEQARQSEKVRIDLAFVRTSPQYCSRQRQMLRFLSSDIKNYCVSYDWFGMSSHQNTQDGIIVSVSALNKFIVGHW